MKRIKDEQAEANARRERQKQNTFHSDSTVNINDYDNSSAEDYNIEEHEKLNDLAMIQYLKRKE